MYPLIIFFAGWVGLGFWSAGFAGGLSDQSWEGGAGEVNDMTRHDRFWFWSGVELG